MKHACGWVNDTCSKKYFECSVLLERHYINGRPLTISYYIIYYTIISSMQAFVLQTLPGSLDIVNHGKCTFSQKIYQTSGMFYKSLNIHISLW